ncbi:MAG: HAD family hydrolase [Cardiobacteriaceae bacterium]|nr:HAD family hydrolase [Cardiobacteriaceae bacterium]
MKNILWFLDIDGCLSAGKFKRFDLEALRDLETLCQERNLSVVLCTGRSLSYLEALYQVVQLGEWAIADHGALLFHLQSDTVISHPLFTPEARQKLHDLTSFFAKEALTNARFRLSHGKAGSLSLVAEDQNALDLKPYIMENFDYHGFDLHASGKTVDFTIAGLDKWQGAQFYLKHQQIQNKRLAAIGDSHGDLPILRQVEISACPHNAHPDLKALCTYTSPYPYARGVLDILEHYSR